MEMTSEDAAAGNTDVVPETKPKRQSLSLVVLGAAIFLAGCTLSILAPFYTKEAEDHGLSVTSSGTVFASAFVLQIVATPVFGKHLQRLGSNRLFVFGSLVSGVTTVVFGFLPGIEAGPTFLAWSLVIRSLTAVGEAAMSTAVYPLAMRCAPGHQATMLAVMETMFGAGTTIGPFLGGFLFDYGGFVTPFVTCGGLLLACALMGCLVLPRAGPEAGEDSEDTPEHHDADPSLGAASYRRLLSSPLMLVAASVTLLTGVSTQWYQPSLEPYVRTKFGLTPFQASLLFIIDGGVYSVVAPLTGKIIDKGVDCVTILGAGSLVICLGYLLMAPAAPFVVAPSLEQIAVGAAVHGLGMAMNFIATLTLMTQLAEAGGGSQETVHGLASSIWITCESLGGVVGAAGGGASYDRLGWVWSCLLVAGLQAASMVAVVALSLAATLASCRARRRKERLLQGAAKQSYGTLNNNILSV